MRMLMGSDTISARYRLALLPALAQLSIFVWGVIQFCRDGWCCLEAGAARGVAAK